MDNVVQTLNDTLSVSSKAGCVEAICRRSLCLATTYCVHAIEEQVQLVKVIGILGINVI